MMKYRILKTGVGIHEDAKRLLRYLVIDEVNCVVDIALLYKFIIYHRAVAQYMGHKDLKTSLQYLTEKYLKIVIDKGMNQL